MKKISFLLVALLLSFANNSIARAADGVLDQFYTEGTGSLLICTGSRMYQTFKPTKSILTNVEIEVTDPSGDLSVRVMSNEGGWHDVTENITQTAVNGWNAFDFTNVPVTPGNTYSINVTGDCSSKWKYGEGNPYPDGEMVWQSFGQPTRDFNFMTFGKDEVTDPEEPTATPAVDGGDGADATATATVASGDADDSTSGTTGGENIGKETLGEVSNTISKAGNLVAKYLSKNGSVSLTWKASTTADIDGYKIFRSEKEKTGFVKVGEVKKDKTVYVDKHPIPGKLMYYQVRAYRKTLQSASSNTAKIKVPEVNKALTASVDTAQVEKTFMAKYWPYLLLLLLMLAVGIILIVKRYKDKKSQSSVLPDHGVKS